MSAVRAKKTKVDTAQPGKKAVMSKLITLNPRLSEKAYSLSEQLNTYIFDVGTNTNKLDITKAVSAQYEVAVKKIRIAAIPGKAKRTYRKGGRKSVEGKRSNVRKAYVTLKEGDKLPLFAAVDETDAPKENK